jgi:hypothetical protein
LMQRAVDADYAPHMLTEQFRMPQAIATMVSNMCYNGKLQTFGGKTETVGSREQQIRWFDSEETERSLKNSYVSFEQAAIVVKLLTEKLNSENCLGGQHASQHAPPLHARVQIMVICMYRPQTKLIQSLLHKLAPNVLQSDNFRLITVDAAQGSEADHVIVVTTRSNAARKIGFCSDLRRLNVAISRPKQSLTVVGSLDTMTSDENWNVVAEAASVIRTDSFPLGDAFLDTVEDIASDLLPKAQVYGEAPMSITQSHQSSGGVAGTTKICSFYLKGTCTRGSSCPFSHEKGGGKGSSGNLKGSSGKGSIGNKSLYNKSLDTRKDTMCSFFLQGKCTKGSSCPFSHGDGQTSGGGKGTGTQKGKGQKGKGKGKF